jgi:hypothetical protein
MGKVAQDVGRARVRLARSGGIALVMMGLALSCGDGGGAGSVEAFVGSYCDLFSPCCAAANLRSDGQTCRLFLGAFAPAGRYDKQKGEACLAAMKQASMKADFCQQSDGATPTVCDEVFGPPQGTKAPGETCDGDDDCAPSSEGKVDCASSFSGSAQVRKCQVQVRGKAGDKPCIGSVEGSTTYSNLGGDDLPAKGFLCYDQDGLRCDSVSDTCVAYKLVGEACTSNGFARDCVATAYCDVALRKCAARKPAGAACGDGASSAQVECAAGNYCPAGGTCAAQAAQGAACTADKQCLTDSCVNGMCRPSPSADFGLALICGTK